MIKNHDLQDLKDYEEVKEDLFYLHFSTYVFGDQLRQEKQYVKSPNKKAR